MMDECRVEETLCRRLAEFRGAVQPRGVEQVGFIRIDRFGIRVRGCKLEWSCRRGPNVLRFAGEERRMTSTAKPRPVSHALASIGDLTMRYREVRALTERLREPLSAEDCQIQS